MAELKEFTVERSGKRALRFKGEVLAGVRNEEDCGRWQEIGIYRVGEPGSGRYVAEIVGRTRWEGERDSHEAYICNSLEEVLQVLTEPDPDHEGEIFISNLVKRAIEEAAKSDPAFKDLLVEDI